MKKTTLLAGLLALANVGALGCKTTPKTAWWKSSKDAESTAVAHTAPTPPSQLAAQGAGSQSALAQAGGDAWPFVPGGSPTKTASATTPVGGYPSTDAPAFTPQVAQQIAATSATAGAATGGASVTPTTTNLGSIAATPYNPATPPQQNAAVASTTSPIPESRYALSATSAAPTFNATAPSDAATDGTDAASSVASTLAGGATLPGAVDATAPAPAFDPGAASRYATTTAADLMNSSPVIGATSATDRYANQVASAATDATTAAATAGAAGTAARDATTPAANDVQAATATIAATPQPYRPGGTSSYPATTAGSAAPQYIATRPEESAPAVNRPGSAAPTASSTTPGATTPRYW